ELAPRQRSSYERAARDGLFRLEALGRDITITHVLELIVRLKQICNFCPETGRSAKLDDLRHRLAGVVDAGEKALVFSQFIEPPFGIRRLAEELHALEPLILSGDMSIEE